MKTIVKLRWLVLALWVLGVAALVLSAPNMQELVREKGQIKVPDGYSSTNAAAMLSAMEGEGSGESGQSTVIVFHNEKGLTEADMEAVRNGIEALKSKREELGIVSLVNSFDTPELKTQTVSEDKTTVLALANVTMNGRTSAEASEALYDALADVSVEHYLTGNWIIQEDVIQSSEEGLKRTEWITVVFILAILLIVFRSLIAPLIPLLTIGISYAASQSIVAFLVKYADFPLSNFTQIFLVAVMFGIGTDYCILLISRFKEELARGADRLEAIATTYRTSGRTVLVSGLAVLVGFSAIGFSTFGLYRSAVAVAVGVAVLLIALTTLVPFFMAVLGQAIFWPSRGALEHKPSRIWGAVGRFSLRRPIGSLAILAVIVVPFLVSYKGDVSYNSLDEIGDRYDSVKAFNIISDSFGPGDSLPATVVLKAGKPLDDTDGLAMIERVTREIAEVDGVKAVRSATRPTGEALKDFQVASQASTLDSGLEEGAEGLGQVASGLKSAGDSLSGKAPELQSAAEGAEKLADGTKSLKNGIVQLGDGLKRIEQGLKDGSIGAGELSAGLKEAQASAEQLASASARLSGSYRQLETGLEQLTQGYNQAAAAQQALAAGLSDLGQGLGGLADKYPELKQDADFLKAQGAVAELQTSAEQLGAQYRQMNAQLAGIAQGLGRANAGLAQASAGQARLTEGLRSLAAGIVSLQKGLEQAASGQGQIIAKLPEMTAGADELAAGQEKLAEGFSQLTGQLGELTDGLNDSVDGLEQIEDGLKSARGYLGELSSSSDKELTGWFAPEEALDNEDFREALDTYLSDDRLTARFDVVFDGNPYEIETLEKTDDVQAAVARALKGTDYANASYAVGGVSSINNDLRNISSADYTRTVVLMLAGIAVILVVMFRSLVIPIYLILSLLATYYTSMAVNELIFVRLLGYSGTSWVVPFFGFVMLMALGVDYSIFLMDRFKENRHMGPQEAILSAMKSMGTVIMSAAVILGGTFAAMLPSGVLSLLQIATIVLSGLFLYALVMLPLFIPVMIRMFGEANWWPFMGGREKTDKRASVGAASSWEA
ncbi:MMPL family transporter [Cohnella laeviribosi]|uniref:MMPL family transporter n=1 Tax=Cohnella laeviribosi TaxID=380174 RepID=UPI000382D1F5|nr:MMPL family transporter [Cohnella laeviribosi]